VVVLSNNDGCIISASSEAKAIGIQVGVPYFKVKGLLKRARAAVFSSNFALYANISRRVMAGLSELAPEIHVYSIDEAFLNYSGVHQDPEEIASGIKERIERDIGVPISVGISTTKVLAKLANAVAKKSQGTCTLFSSSEIDHILQKTRIDELWGLSSKSAEKMRLIGIKNALELKNFPNEKLIQKILSKTGLALKNALCGEESAEFEHAQSARQQIFFSRSLARATCDYSALEQALATFTSSAAEKLRRQRSSARQLHVYLLSTPKYESWNYQAFKGMTLPAPTSDTRQLITHAFSILKEIFREGLEYQKVGIALSDLSLEQQSQLELFTPLDSPKSQRLMKVIDDLNKRLGPGAIRSFATGPAQAKWQGARNFLSPSYTNDWDHLPRSK
jgi:DNA polymerase V